MEQQINRKGALSVKDGRKRFIDYYENKGTRMGQLRGKMFDIMYQKKPKKTFKCNHTNADIELEDGNIIEPGMCEQGSNKYLLEKGPKTFDLEGIDSFEEDEEIVIPNDEDVSVISRGSTYYIDGVDTEYIDQDTLIEKNDKFISDEIYGPRLNKDDDNNQLLYNQHFKNLYNEREEPRNLVDIYWDRYHNRELNDGRNSYNYVRKNRKTRKNPYRENNINQGNESDNEDGNDSENEDGNDNEDDGNDSDNEDDGGNEDDSDNEDDGNDSDNEDDGGNEDGNDSENEDDGDNEDGNDSENEDDGDKSDNQDGNLSNDSSNEDDGTESDYEEAEVEIKEWNGTSYHVDISTQKIYDVKTGDQIGVWDNENEKPILNEDSN